MMAKIAAKGQLTIPKKIMEMLGVEPGDRILFSTEDNKTVISPIKESRYNLRGSLAPRKIPEELDKVREEVKRKVARRIANESIR